MQTLLFFTIAVVLTAIAFEDFKSKTVHAFWFPVLFLLALVYAIQFESGRQLFEQALISLSFLLIQGILLVTYFVIKNKRWINVTRSYLGWGDILFLLVVVPFFSSFVFVLFYLSSLLLTILFVVVCQLTGRKMIFIPLAGIQSICLFAIVLYHQCIQPILFNEMYLPLML